MPRFRDVDWDLTRSAQTGAIESWQQVEIAVLMDIRDALKPLRRLDCYEFIRIPSELRAIKRALQKENRDRRKRPSHRCVAARARLIRAGLA